MFFLNSYCNETALGRILYVVKNILTAIEIITPIVLILMLSIHFTRAALNPDDKKKNKRILNSVIAMVVVFLIPVIVNVTMHIIGEKTNISECWINAPEPEDEKQTAKDYISDDKDEHKQISNDKYPDKPPGN